MFRKDSSKERLQRGKERNRKKILRERKENMDKPSIKLEKEMGGAENKQERKKKR